MVKDDTVVMVAYFY